MDFKKFLVLHPSKSLVKFSLRSTLTALQPNAVFLMCFVCPLPSTRSQTSEDNAVVTES